MDDDVVVVVVCALRHQDKALFKHLTNSCYNILLQIWMLLL